MITVYTGLPGQGKSIVMAFQMMKILKRNLAYKKKTGRIREVYSNIKLSSDIEDQYHEFIKYWTDPYTLLSVRDSDIFWDEISTHLDSANWEKTSLDMKRFLRQHRKYGVDIICNTQDFLTVDISFRRLCNEVWLLRKLIGSPDMSATKPEVKSPWGILLLRLVDPTCYGKEKEEYEFTSTRIRFITKFRCSVYDTRQEISGGLYPPLKHIERKCIDPDCSFVKTEHK